MKRFILAITLACALSVTALAGEVSTTGAPAPGNTQGPTIATTIVLTILSLIR
jgi:hypothetical protein